MTGPSFARGSGWSTNPQHLDIKLPIGVDAKVGIDRSFLDNANLAERVALLRDQIEKDRLAFKQLQDRFRLGPVGVLTSSENGVRQIERGADRVAHVRSFVLGAVTVGAAVLLFLFAARPHAPGASPTRTGFPSSP